MQLASQQQPLCEGNILLVFLDREQGKSVGMLDLKPPQPPRKCILFGAQMSSYLGNNSLHMHCLGGKKSSSRGGECPPHGGWSWGSLK